MRSVSHIDRRVLEAMKLGFTKMVVPAAASVQATGRLQGMNIVHCRTIREAIQAVFGRAIMKQPASSRAVAAKLQASDRSTSTASAAQPAMPGWPSREDGTQGHVEEVG